MSEAVIEDDLFWAKVYEDENGCWIWGASLDTKGYGQLGRRGRLYRAHRYCWEVIFGNQRTPGLELDHTCREKRCVRPDHLEEVTHAENIRRAKSLDLKPTHCPAGHQYNVHGKLNAKGSWYCLVCSEEKGLARRRARGVQPSRCLRPEAVQEVLELRRAGHTLRAIAEQFGVSNQSIFMLCKKNAVVPE